MSDAPAPNPTTRTPLTQRQRWARYGANAAAMVLATLAIVILANWLVYRHGANWGRFDWTATRSHSLSPQTLRILEGLGTDVQITSFHVRDAKQAPLLDRISDLLDEYTRRSERIRTASIDPGRNPEARDDFYRQILRRYDDETESSRRAIERARGIYDRAKAFAAEMPDALTDLIAAQPGHDVTLVARELHQYAQRLPAELEQAREQTDKALSDVLPDYAAARSRIFEPLGRLASNLSIAGARFRKAAGDVSTPAAAQEKLLQVAERFEQFAPSVRRVVESFREVRSPDYDEMRQRLLARHALIVSVAPPSEEPAGEASTAFRRGLLVLNLEQFYPNLLRARQNNEIAPEEGYKGEELLTSALVRLTFRHGTKVVLVNPNTAPALFRVNLRSPNTWLGVANSLRQMNYEVEEWQPAGGISPFGQKIQPQPRPRAKPGQRLIYVVLPEIVRPNQPPTPAMPVVAKVVHEHLEAGGAALLFAGPSSLKNFGKADPLLDPLQDAYGLDVRNDRQILTAVPGREGKAQTTNQFQTVRWPTEHAIGRALRGLRGLAIRAVPVHAADTAPDDVRHWTLAQSPENTWADTEYANVSAARKNEDDPSGPLPFAAAVEKTNRRLIVIGDPTFAADSTTLFGPRDPVFGQVMYAAFPANAELFLNGVHWLARLDDLIAPGARTGDVRRIDEISRGALTAVWWTILLILPGLCLGAGAVVWLVRRR